MVADPARPRLLTIPISHYCEKARWALERARIDYREQPHVQLVHRIVAMRTGAGRKVPILVTDEGALAESAAIVRWADRRLPEDQRLVWAEDEAEITELERGFDDDFGPESRRWVYANVIGTDIPFRFGNDTLPGWERRLLPLGMPVLKIYASRVMDAAPEESASALAASERTFDAVAERIADGRRFLIGDRFSAADLAFAALAAPLLAPEHYGARLPQPADMPPPMAATVTRMREHPAGRFAMRLVAEERPWPPRSTSAAHQVD